MQSRRRIMIKLSGEALAGTDNKAIDPIRVRDIAKEIRQHNTYR